MYANVNGYRIFFDVQGLQYVSEGAVMRERPVCLVMHGGHGADHSHFLPDLTPLSEYCQLIYIDDRNCGLSDHIDYTTNSIRQNVEDIEALREYLGLDKVFVLGHSYGGIKAQYYAAHHPEHLYGAMIITTMPCAEDYAVERVLKNIRKFGTEEQYEIYKSYSAGKDGITAEQFMEVMLPLYHGKGKFRDPEMREESKHVVYNTELNIFQNHNELLDPDRFNLIPDLKKVDLPCVVIAGERDFICDADANRDIAEAIPGCEFHLIKDGSHEVFADYPEIVFPILRDFIDRNFKK